MFCQRIEMLPWYRYALQNQVSFSIFSSTHEELQILCEYFSKLLLMLIYVPTKRLHGCYKAMWNKRWDDIRSLHRLQYGSIRSWQLVFCDFVPMDMVSLQNFTCATFSIPYHCLTRLFYLKVIHHFLHMLWGSISRNIALLMEPFSLTTLSMTLCEPN